MGFRLNPALSVGTNRTLAQMAFVAVPQIHSALVLLKASNPAGLEADGTQAAKPGAANGRVIVVGHEPVMDATFGSNGLPVLALRAIWVRAMPLPIPRTWLAPIGNWAGGVLLTNAVELFNVNGSGPGTFYKAYESLLRTRPFWNSTCPVAPTVNCWIYGRSGTNYIIQTSTNLSGPAA